ncbi:MAG: tetratricopeptide repeat protein, partial [Myxococcota bacterium]|nr:tetratricopeptide repeat protein [Myxococcota bacterium]
ELAERAFGLREADPPERRAERLARELQELGIAEAAPLLAGTLGLPVSERQAGVATSARERRRQTLNALVAWVLALGERQRVVLVVEDLHWADPSTLEWLGLLFEPCATARVLLLATYRPGFAPPWPDRGHVTGVTLERLAHGRARELAVAAAGGTLPETLIKQVATRSDGVPLFVEELAKDVVESHAQPCSPRTLLRIPATLEDSLMARLDRVGEAKQVAQLGATLGREFPYALIQAVSATDETRLRKGLERLVGAELLHQRGSPPSSVYAFKHALVQDAAYASLLESRRRALHGCIVDALHAHFPERVEREPEVAGHHCEAAGRSAEAIDHYQRAGKLAAESFAHAEASAHLERALGLLRRFPQAPERDEQEIELLLALAPSVSAAKGYAADELRQVFERARALCRGLGGHGSELFAAVFGLSNFHSIRGELQTSLELAEEALRLAEQAGNQRETQGAHARLGINLFGLSDLARAVEHLEQAIRLHDPAHTHPHDVFARSFLGSALLVLGLPDRARRTSHEAIELARGRDPSVLAMALGVDATLHYRLREPEATRKRAEEAIAIAEERGLPFPRALATTYRGWAVGGSEGLRDLRRGLAQFAELGAEERRPHAPLAEAYRDLGRTEEALAELEAALASRSEARTWDAELHRFKGEILLEQGEPEEGLCCLRRAHEISRRQGARLLELRAVLSLARVLRAQGRPEEARALVQPVYHGFTEGFDTLDLKDAKALLEELA